MSHDPLELAEHNYSFLLAEALALVSTGKESGSALATVSFCHRILGLCALLRDADTSRFATCLCKSGQARLQLLRLAAAGQPIPPKVLCVSKDVGFTAALAVGAIQTASAIAAHSPAAHVDGWEYEDDFLFYRFLQLMLGAPADGDVLQRLLARWREVLQGEELPHAQACEALLTRDEKRFALAMDAVIDRRRDSLRKYKRELDFDREVDATEGKVFVDGLALVKLAEVRGLQVPARYEMLPRLALNARCGSLPEDAWRSP
jgi:hypothetical protein